MTDKATEKRIQTQCIDMKRNESEEVFLLISKAINATMVLFHEI